MSYLKMLESIIYICLLLTPKILFAQQEAVGLVIDGYGDHCKVKHQNSDSLHGCLYGEQLYNGDTLMATPSIHAIKIEWLAPPYTHGVEINDTTLGIIFEKPPDNNLLSTILQFMGFQKSIHLTKVAAADRGIDQPPIMPGNNSTVLLSYPIIFSWIDKGGKSIIVRDSAGTIIFRKQVERFKTISISAKEIGLHSSIQYTWEIEGLMPRKIHFIRLVSDSLAYTIDSTLKAIDESVGENNLLKAIYFQNISDDHPSEVDLYWLSYAMLEKEDPHKNIVQLLKNNIKIHQNSEFSIK